MSSTRRAERRRALGARRGPGRALRAVPRRRSAARAAAIASPASASAVGAASSSRGEAGLGVASGRPRARRRARRARPGGGRRAARSSASRPGEGLGAAPSRSWAARSAVSRPQTCGALAVALGELLLDRRRGARRPPRARPRSLPARRGPPRRAARRRRARRRAPRSSAPAGELELRRLALEPGVDVGGLRLLLQRTQARRASRSTSSARSRLSWVRSSFSWARRRRLRCLPRPAASSTSRRRSRGLRVDDLLDPALADHRVHLAAEVGVGEDLDHVGQAAAGAVEPVVAVARARAAATTEISENSDAGGAVGVVDHDLDLGVALRADARAAGVDHVLHRLAADAQRALLAERPEDRVGDVRLAAAVRADDHADARRKLELGALGEGLEALDGDRAEMHACAGSLKPRVRSDGIAAGRTRTWRLLELDRSACRRPRPARPPSSAPGARAERPRR